MMGRLGVPRPRRVLILGGGFGGTAVAQQLERTFASDPSVEVTLVSRDNYLLFVPMLPEVASGAIELTHILSPLRRLCPRTRIRTEVVQSIDLANRQVTTAHASTRDTFLLEFDLLVIALGNVTNLSGLPGLAQHGLPIKTIGDALFIRNHVIDMLEGADALQDPDERRRRLTFVVAGGGFSGVEIAAELNDFVRQACTAYRHLDPRAVRIILLHGGNRILPEFPTDLALYAQRKLGQRGVEIQLNARIAAATAVEAILVDGRRIETRTLVVAIGASLNPAVAALEVEKERAQIVVNDHLEIPGYPGVWALGDCARVINPRTGQPSPPTAQFALRQGGTVASNVAAALGRGKSRPFTFTGLGQLVSLGRRMAVAEIKGGLKLSGPLAWVLWRSFYLLRLPGIERKTRVLLDWSLDLLFHRDIVQVNVGRTERVAMAHYEPGEEIVRQGDPADLFYVILQGQVQVVRRADGQERELARLGPGESFGEVGLLRMQRRNATVRAVKPVDVLSLEKGDFAFMMSHWRALADLLRAQSEQRG
jgi:NADH:ubiquinone reductase (H+-translocating)